MIRIATPLIALLLALLAPVATAQPSVREQLAALAERAVAAIADDDPIVASFLGLPGVDGRLPRPSEAARAATIARLEGWKRELEAIERGGGRLGLVDANNVRLLRALVDQDLGQLVLRREDRRSYARPALYLVAGIFTQFLNLPVVGREGATEAHLDRAWDDLVARLEQGSAFIVAGQALVTEPGRLQATVGAQQLAGVPDFFRGPLSEAAAAQMAARPATLARFAAARDAVLATMAETRAVLDARDASWPENHAIGKAAYERMLREERLLPFGAAEIEHIGRNLLAHGWAEEAWLTALSRKHKLPFGPQSGGGLAPGGPALVGYYRDRIAELTSFVSEHEIVTVPAWLGAMQVLETPAFLQPVSPGASMFPPRLFAKSGTGYYFITPPKSLEEAAKRLDMNEDFDRDRIGATAGHEAMPGHFLQLSIARRHPDLIRRLQRDGAFAEGWAFYGEEMLAQLGLYGDGLDARLFNARWERVRGARAIVDVKLAAGEWSVEQAVDFYEKHSGFTRGAAQAAVNGIALGPGYVISYAVGRLQLQTLLAEYMLRTGERGSLRDFHDRLLSYGTTPFAVLGPELLADLDKPAAAVREAANY